MPRRLLAGIAFIFTTFLSVVVQGASPFVTGVWCGNVTSTSATVAARLDAPGQWVRLRVSVSPDLSQPLYSTFAYTTAATAGAVKVTAQGLEPDTEYYYGFEVDGVLRTEIEARGRFRTFPRGRASFKIAFGSCGDFRHANQSAYEEIMRERPLLFINMGDLHYSDTNSADPDDYRKNYDDVLRHPVQGALYREVPLAYMWDDHDYSGNDADTFAIGREPARAVYRERVPHYPIGPAGGAIGQAFTIGRVRVIMTDLRSASVPTSWPESPAKTRMGTAQKAWFKQELIHARDSGFPLVLWVSPDPWIAPAAVGDDTWGGHARERTEIANFIRDNRIRNVVLLSGDMHGLAFDDGTNSDFATGGGAPMVVLHGAALSSGGSSKGGPYSGGVLPGSQQYGMLEIYDNGGPSIACRFLGMKAGQGPKMTHIFSSSAEEPKNQALVNLSTLTRLNSPDDVLVGGFVISGGRARDVLVRAIGPTLSIFGVKDALPHAKLAVFQGERQLITNDGWSRDSSGLQSEDIADRLNSAFDRAGAFRLLDESSRDSALIISLEPGAYTAHVRSGNGTAGTALLEVYDLP